MFYKIFWVIFGHIFTSFIRINAYSLMPNVIKSVGAVVFCNPVSYESSSEHRPYFGIFEDFLPLYACKVPRRHITWRIFSISLCKLQWHQLSCIGSVSTSFMIGLCGSEVGFWFRGRRIIVVSTRQTRCSGKDSWFGPGIAHVHEEVSLLCLLVNRAKTQI